MTQSITFLVILWLVISSIIVYTWIIRPKRRTRKGKHIKFFYRLPEGYCDLRGYTKTFFFKTIENLEGVFTKNPSDLDDTMIIIKSYKDSCKLQSRRNYTLDAIKESTASVIEENNRIIGNYNFHLIETHDVVEGKDINMLIALFSKDEFTIEFQTAYRPNKKEETVADFNGLLASIQI